MHQEDSLARHCLQNLEAGSARAPSTCRQGPSSAAAGGSSSIGISRLVASSCIDSSSKANPAAAQASAGTAIAAAGTAAADEEGFQLRSRLGNDRERQSLYDDVLQRLPWEDIEDDVEADDEDSMQDHSSFLSRRWGPQQPQRQQQRQRLSVDGGLGFGRAAAEQLLGGIASEGSVEWYEKRLLEVRLSCE
jgi:hypothetical protein